MAKSNLRPANSKGYKNKVELRVSSRDNNIKSKQTQNIKDMSDSESLHSVESVDSVDGDCQSSNLETFENTESNEPGGSQNKTTSKGSKSSPLRMSVMLNLNRNQPAMTARERVLNWRVETDFSDTEMVPFEDLSSQPSTSSGFIARSVSCYSSLFCTILLLY